MAARLRLLALSLTSCALAVALFAPAALARNVNPGEGTYGETALLVFVLSVIQHRLEKRKDHRLAAQHARAESADWRGGW